MIFASFSATVGVAVDVEEVPGEPGVALLVARGCTVSPQARAKLTTKPDNKRELAAREDRMYSKIRDMLALLGMFAQEGEPCFMAASVFFRRYFGIWFISERATSAGGSASLRLI